MNPLYIINYLIFSVFLVLLLLEAGVAIMMLLYYKEYKDRLRGYLMPIWEVDSTFAVFYLVNFEATYPKLLTFLGGMYIIPLFLAFLFFMLRNAFLVYSEYIGKEHKRDLYTKIYGGSTLVVAFLVIAVLSSGVSGFGVNVSEGTGQIVSMLINPFDISVFLCSILISFFLAASYFKIPEAKTDSLVALPLAFILMISALFAFVPAMFSSMLGLIYLPIISAALMLAAVAFQARNSPYAAHLGILWLFVSINFFGIVEYPNFFGDVNITTYLTNAAAAVPTELVTVAGGILIAVSITYLVYLSYVKREGRGGY
ncbi:MAG: cytochrome d ubiquinol oxidase subunit II [Candidatus Micrarchaeota archaeon]|nr:cytochrome d ubiquinol oxidase subunit II [Candidatus Micrarchaeota archaeon]MDE1848166.1 cytochrome d ubiquinol oxidase subunit II [Candidatus Micrarchaeota archaeon]MDE1864646.1 cytochrome d ubiquinol oxidase subunit II [Candidatus Micrarchaeota archaeon]